MRKQCPIYKPVSVIGYWRFRLGQWESVTTHCRKWPLAKAA